MLNQVLPTDARRGRMNKDSLLVLSPGTSASPQQVTRHLNQGILHPLPSLGTNPPSHADDWFSVFSPSSQTHLKPWRCWILLPLRPWQLMTHQVPPSPTATTQVLPRPSHRPSLLRPSAPHFLPPNSLPSHALHGSLVCCVFWFLVFNEIDVRF